jgi:type 1 glutamine amidotransferase
VSRKGRPQSRNLSAGATACSAAVSEEGSGNPANRSGCTMSHNNDTGKCGATLHVSRSVHAARYTGPSNAERGDELFIRGNQTGWGREDRRTPLSMCFHLVLGAISLLILIGTVQQGAWAQAAPRIPGQNPDGLRVFLWSGLKTHSAGQHDYPQFLADWSKILTEHGAVVKGALHPPDSAGLEDTDVVVIYKGDAGYLSESQKAALETFVKRGGGLVSLHDSLCGPDPAYFSKLVGGAKKHGEVNYTLDAPIRYTVVDKANPIMKDMSDMTVFDEAFFEMTWAKDPAIHVLATAEIPATRSAGDHKGENVPQIWTYEHALADGQPARAFVWMQGHTYANFANYQIQRTLLRGIAWAGKKPVDELVSYVPPPRPTRTRMPPANSTR